VQGLDKQGSYEAALVAATHSPDSSFMLSLKHFLRGIWLILILPAIAFGSQPVPAPIAAEIEKVFAAYDRDGSPGCAVGVVKDGKLIFSRGYGRANLDYNVAITSGTAFHLASLSKQFTAAAVALLILDGKLTLETPVSTYFPEIAHFQADLRIKHLIYFTSGLPEYTSLPRSNGSPWFSYYYFTIDEAVATTLRAPSLKFAPGTQWEYSNSNFMLLAKIVERVSGMPLADFLHQRVFAPLGMDHTLVDDDTTTVTPNRATGYVERSDPEVRRQLESVGVHIREGAGYAQLLRVSPHYGGSGVFSTIEDLAKWDDNVYTNKLGGPAFTALMLKRVRFSHDKDNDAFGLVFGTFAGREMIWFSGGDLDTSTFMARLPTEHLTVICLSNMPTGDAESKAKQVLSVLLIHPTIQAQK
jgi:CubicO group peptidase (beta-lactamase class C family)